MILLISFDDEIMKFVIIIIDEILKTETWIEIEPHLWDTAAICEGKMGQLAEVSLGLEGRPVEQKLWCEKYLKSPIIEFTFARNYQSATTWVSWTPPILAAKIGRTLRALAKMKDEEEWELKNSKCIQED